MLDPLPQSDWSRLLADHLLFRAGYGGTPEVREAVYIAGRDGGVSAAVDLVLNPAPNWDAFPFPDWTASGPLLEQVAGGEGRREYAHWLADQMRRTTPVAGKMLKFWLDHFPIDWGTLGNRTQKLFYLFRHTDILRRGALGNFNQLLKDVSRSEGMIKMLDLDESKVGAVNENFGRELLELFTLGVDGGYDEDHVQTAAEAFTGYKVRSYNANADDRGYPFEHYVKTNHVDVSDKHFFVSESGAPNLTGNNQGDQAIDAITGRIACALHMCWKFWRYFVSPVPDEALIQQLAIRFQGTYGYEVEPVLREIFESRVFYAKDTIGRMVKDPIDWLLVNLNTLEAEMLPWRVQEATLSAMGYEPMYPPSIQGWPEPEGVGNQWLSTSSMVFRMNGPTIWTHKNTDLFSSKRTNAELEAYPEIDLDSIAPPHLRTKENFNLLLITLQKRFFPFHEIRGSQQRLLYDRFIRVRDAHDATEATRDVLRLILAMPEHQLQ
jgi:uncharacterized protein (DUF1800 family)